MSPPPARSTSTKTARRSPAVGAKRPAPHGKAKAARETPPRYAPQLPTLVKEPPVGDVWVHELKYDGYRIGCRMAGGVIQLVSRNGKDWTDRFSEVANAATRLAVRSALLDGEVALLLPDGRTSFQALQNAFAGRSAGGEILYFVFDLLYLDGEDLTGLALEQRKQRLHGLLRKKSGVLRYVEHVVGNGTQVFREACRHGAEGIVSKRRDLPYQPGRGPGWVKTKCLAKQEFVIGGFTDPQGSREGIGALLVGVYDESGGVVYAGKVGTGFSRAAARELRQKLTALATRECPFVNCPKGQLGRLAHWVRPQLVAEVAFTEWTNHGKIRHPSFQGLRADKSATEVIRERPRDVKSVAPAASATAKSPKRRASRAAGAEAATVAGVRITHPDRVLYPDIGLTKLELAQFYEGIADSILPHLAGRPLTLVRCPDGIGPSCFYMKHANVWAPEGLRRVRIRERTKVGEYLVADSLTALIGLVQMDILEIHTWNSTVDHLEQPDRVIFDLDPGPAVAWAAVIEAARVVRTALDALELRSFVKTTGRHGLHVVVPLLPQASWSDCLAFTRALSAAIVRMDPKSYTTEFSKAGRERKILVDYMRNNRGSTSVAAFSTRARAGAPVSVPLAWEELSARLRSDHYTVRNLARRLKGLRGDPWSDYWTTRQRLPPDAIERLNAVGPG